MASLRKIKDRYEIQFTGADKKRRTLRPGKIPKRDATTIKTHVEAILSSALAGNPPPDETARWLARLPEAMYDKLAAVGLTVKRQRATLDAFIGEYIDKRKTTKKPATLIVWGHVRRNLVDRFGAGKPLREITAGDADDWRLWLDTHEVLAENTI